MPDTSPPPHTVENVEHVLIPMPDGAKLAARLWLPEDEALWPVPGILEYIPYRKRDLTRARDAGMHGWFAGHGYACVRADIRGSGESDGIIVDQYRQQEQDDALAILRWMAEQPWCDGKIGMIGHSWGGFSALQVAALRPPELHAIIASCATDDLYADNMHYKGGCLLTDNLAEASTMFSINASPPDPALVGDRWQQMWMQRLEGSGLWLETWLRHQRRDAYWQHGSVCHDYSAIACPVFAVGGWADGFTDAIFRLAEHVTAPCKGLIGPWSHNYPHLAVPGPRINFLGECLRWWDHWLKDQERGVEQDPLLRVWMQDSAAPTAISEYRDGRWVAEQQWPSPRVEQRRYLITRRHLDASGSACPEHALNIESPLSVGLFAGKWCSYLATPDLPGDQREEDGGCLVFDSDVLDEPVEIFGRPVVELEISVNKPCAMIAVRLSDVAPHGSAARVTYGLLNLSHRDSHEHPQPLEPGKRYRVRVTMNGCAQRFPAGHALRLAVSTSYWPLAWLPPEPARLTLYAGRGELTLPVRPPREADAELAPLGEPESAPKPEITALSHGERDWRVTRHLADNRSTLEVIKDEGRWRIDEIDLELANKVYECHSAVAGDFTSIEGSTTCERSFAREGWDVRTVAYTRLTSDVKDFHIHARLDAYHNRQRVYCQSWNLSIPRDEV